jgi:putative ABC transport system permease protein
MLPSILEDVRYGMRQLRRSPAFTVVAVTTLALGIGANTAIFQMVDAIRLRALPVPEPQRLFSVDLTKEAFRAGYFPDRFETLTHGQWEQLREQQQAFTGVLAWGKIRFNLAPGGESRFAKGLFVSGGFFGVLGIEPLFGRTFGAQEDTPGCSFGAVVSHGFWQRELGGDPGVLGRRLSLDGHSVPVIGVTPPSFHGLEVGNRYDVAVPLCAQWRFAEEQRNLMTMPDGWWLSVMGRLRPGWTLARLQEHLRALSPGIMAATLPPTYSPADRKKYLANELVAAEASGGVSELRQNYEPSLWLMLATSALVLLIACANLANLLLARARAREREIAIRLAIGASRGRLVRQLLVESLLLAAAGTLLGTVLACASSEALVGLISSAKDPEFLELPVDWRLLGFAAGLAGLTCLLFGLLPALRATQLAPAASLRSGGRTMTGGRERVSLRRTLVVAQVSLSLVLLVGSLLFARSLRNLLATEPGFRADGVFSVALDLSRSGIAPERRPAVFRELQAELSAVPGVHAAAQARLTPLSGMFWNREIGPDGTPGANSGKHTALNRVGPGYFATMGTPLIAGRDFEPGDTAGAPRVAVVNEALARQHFGTMDVIGRSFHMNLVSGEGELSFQIVGVVGNTKYFALREPFVPTAFLPGGQDPAPRPTTVFVLRVPRPPDELMKLVTAAVTRVNPRIGIELTSLATQVRESLLRERLIATLSSLFALLAVLLAMLGLYGVVSYLVSQRRTEIGVRLALGADSRRVIGLVLRETLVLLGVGLALGLAVSLWAGRAAASLLYGLEPHDPLTVAAAVALLAGCALLASIGPARRAARMQPTIALRSE